MQALAAMLGCGCMPDLIEARPRTTVTQEHAMATGRTWSNSSLAHRLTSGRTRRSARLGTLLLPAYASSARRSTSKRTRLFPMPAAHFRQGPTAQPLAAPPNQTTCGAPTPTPPTEHARTQARLSNRSLVTAHRITQRAPTPHQFSARRRAELRRVAQLLRRGQRRRWRWRGGLPVGTAAAPTVRACAAVRVRGALSRRSLRCCQGIDRPRSHEVLPVVHPSHGWPRTGRRCGPDCSTSSQALRSLAWPKGPAVAPPEAQACRVRSTRRAWCRCALEHLMTLLRPQGGMHQPRTPSLRRVPPTHSRAAAAPTPSLVLAHASNPPTLALPPSVSSLL